VFNVSAKASAANASAFSLSPANIEVIRRQKSDIRTKHQLHSRETKLSIQSEGIPCRPVRPRQSRAALLTRSSTLASPPTARRGFLDLPARGPVASRNSRAAPRETPRLSMMVRLTDCGLRPSPITLSPAPPGVFAISAGAILP
jgi:hypothetical protein